MLDRVGRPAGEALAAGQVVEQVPVLGIGLEQLAPAVGRLGVLAGFVERLNLPPHLRGEAFDRRRQTHPWMSSGVVSRLGRRREGRVRERPDRDDDQVRLCGFRVEDLRAAVGAEMEDMLLLVRLVGDSRVVAEATDDIHLIR